MLKKLRWRFIGTAMAAFVTVIVALIGAANTWTYSSIASQQDATLDFLAVTGGLRRDSFDPAAGGQEPPKHMSQEARFMTRFFTVRLDSQGNVLDYQDDFIASVQQEQAQEYALRVLSRSASRGYYRGYRYLVRQEGDAYTVIFLNAEQQLAMAHTLLLSSSAVGLVSILAVFVLVYLFSNRAVEPYVRNLQTQKRFITDAGHELKTPITAISTSADVLAMDLEGNEWVKNIQTQSARLSRLVSDLVKLSRLDEEQPFPQRAEFSLSEAIWEISEPAAALAKVRGLDYSQDIPEGLTLVGDRSAIQQMVSILLDNALKYTTEGGRIHLEVHKLRRKTELTLCNTCDPASVPEPERLFDRFYRPDTSRSKKTGGTGIGLAIAKATAEAHGGEISVRCTPQGEILFRVLL